MNRSVTNAILLPSGDQAGETLAHGQAELYINLQAEIFDRALGLLFYMIDQRNAPYGAMYVEDANVWPTRSTSRPRP